MALALTTDSPTLDMSADLSTPSAASAASAAERPTDRVNFWDAIHSAGRDVDALARKTVKQLPTAAHMALLDLHEHMRERLQTLRAELAGHADSERMMLILVFYFDERVMRQLPDSARLRWIPLQREWLGSSHGGEKFYEILDKLLQDHKTRSIVFELFYYCLRNGFVGQYAGNPDAIETYKKYLVSRIDVPPVAERRADSTIAHSPLPQTWHPAWYYLLTLVAIVFMIALMTLATNC